MMMMLFRTVPWLVSATIYIHTHTHAATQTHTDITKNEIGTFFKDDNACLLAHGTVRIEQRPINILFDVDIFSTPPLSFLILEL